MRKYLLILTTLCLAFLSGQGLAYAASTDCATCHQTKVSDFTLTAIDRSQSCAACHSKVGPYHSQPTWTGKLIEGVGYFKDDNSVATMPPNIHDAHNGMNNPSSTDSCGRCHRPVSCDSCHNNVSHTSHGSSVPNVLPTYIMGDGTLYGPKILTCTTADCHNYYTPAVAVKRADGTDLCFNCHSTGLTGHGDLDARHTASITTQVNSLPNKPGPFEINCLQCHQDKLNAEHAGKVNDCNNCHGDTVRADVKAVVDTAKATTDPTQNMAAKDCYKCHTNPPLNHQPAHAAIKNLITDTTVLHTNCNTCHGNAAVNSITANLATSNADYSCLDCHNGAVQAPLHNAVFSGNTQAYAVTDLHTNCATCHGNPLVNDKINALAATKPTSPYSCEDCHTGPNQPQHKAALSAGGTAQDIVGFHAGCNTCHTNDKVTAVISTLKAQGSYLCGDCHNGTIAPVAKHQAETATGQAAVGIVGYHADCATCHSNAKAQALVPGLITATSYQCWNCHDGNVAPAAAHKAALDATPGADSVAYSTPEMHPTCDTCHQTTDTNVKTQINTLAGQTALYSCNVCHTGGLQAKHNATWTNGTAYDTVAFHQDCAQCHSNTNAAVGTKIHSIRTDLKAGTITGYACTECHGPLVPGAVHSAKLDSTATVSQESTQFHQKVGASASESCFVCHGNQVVTTQLSSIVSKVKNGGTYVCTDCHNNTAAAPYQPNHSALLGTEQLNTVNEHPACTTCHTTTADTTIATLKGETGYTCDTCHTNIVAKHASTSDLDNALYMLNCSWCHTSNDPLYATDNLIGVHVKSAIPMPQGTTCNTCHAATSPVKAQVTAKQTGCDQCHDGKAAKLQHQDSQYYPKHVVNQFPTFMPEYSPNCSTCHTDNSLITMHVAESVGCTTCHTTPAYKTAVTSLNTDCAGCHSKTVNPAIDMEDSHKAFHNADTVKNPGSASCLGCHAKDTTVEGQSLLAVHKKSASSAVTCDSCHGVGASVEVKAAVLVKDVNCLTCHKGVSHQHPVAATGYDSSPQVECGNCHGTTTVDKTAELTKIHQTAADKGLITNFSCATCHNATFEGSGNVISGDGTLDMNSNGTAIYCSDCHDGSKAPAKETAHQAEHKATMSENVSCNTCHNGTTVNSVIDSTVAAGQGDFTATHSGGCNTCHDNAKVTAVVTAKVGKVNTVYACADCHDGTNAKVHDKQHTVTSYLTGSTDTSCATCHKAGDVAAIHTGTTASGTAMNCDTCHGASPALSGTSAVITANLSSQTTRSGFTCQSCHTDIAGGHNHSVPVDGYANQANVDCSKCHATATDGTAELTAIHKAAADKGLITNYGCATCHNDTFVGAGKVILKDGIIDMQQNGTTGIYCNSCHNGTLADALGTKYPAHNGNHINSTGYGDYKGTFNGQAFDDSAVSCAKCHPSLDTKVVHDSTVHANVNCNTCHQSTNTEVQKVIADNTSRVATKTPYTCASCHNTLPYKHQPEHLGTSSDLTALDCTQCHATTAWTGGNATLPEVHQGNCNLCHASTNAVVSNVVYSKAGLTNSAYACEVCHVTGGAQTKDVAHQPEHLAKLSATGMTCSSCHNFNLTAGTASDIKAVHSKGCVTCHGADTRADVKLFIASKVGQANAVYNCEDCHGTIHAGWDLKHKPIFPTVQNLNCVNCHQNYLPDEHQKALTTTGNTALGYEVFRSAAAAGPWTSIGKTTATGWQDGGLSAGTTYYYQVRAYDGKPNYSGLGNTFSIRTAASSTSTTTDNPDWARYASGVNGDSANDPSYSTDVLSTLTDNSTNTYKTVKEYGSNDQFVMVRETKDAADYSRIQLKIVVRYSNSGNLHIYPYSSNSAINAAAAVNGPSRSSSYSYITETIDVTNAAKTMNGLGWMKFRIKPDPSGSGDSAYIANVQLILTQAAVSGGTVTNPSGTLAAAANDTTAPSVPSGLTGTSGFYDRIDLSWTASTDTGGVAGDVCGVCHSATAPQQTKDAIANKALSTGGKSCDACHTVHGDITTAHTGDALPTTPWNCSGCHSNVLSTEHSSGAMLAQNATMNCSTCHDSTLGKVTASISSTVTDKSNLVCSSCHSGTADGVPAVHSDLATPHLTSIFPTATDASCLNCHPTQQTEFASTQASFHAVAGMTSKASGKGRYVTGWSATTQMECKSCHGPSTAGGTTAYANILPKAYTYTDGSNNANLLCYTCHDPASYGKGSESAPSGFSDGGKNLHNIGDHNERNLQCSWCHTAVPHGANLPHLIAVTGDPKPYSNGSVLYKYVHAASGNYDKSDCGSNVSMCDEH